MSRNINYVFTILLLDIFGQYKINSIYYNTWNFFFSKTNTKLFYIIILCFYLNTFNIK